MKALLYKEFKLSWHPVCYIFPIVFSFLTLIPNYPQFMGLLLIIPTYAILFLGANKGKQTNDLYYTINLPVRKKDIVIARMLSMLITQMVVIILTSCLAPAAQAIKNALEIKDITSFSLNSVLVTMGFGLIGLILVDALYLLMFYKKGRSVLAPSIISTFIFGIFMAIMCVVLPVECKPYYNFFCDKVWTQFIVFGIALVISVVSHILIAKKAIKLIEKIDF